MTIAWMLYVVLVGALLSIGAWGVEDALRYAKLPTRWVWAAALLGTVGFAGYAIIVATSPAPANTRFAAKVTVSAGAAASAEGGLVAAMQDLRTSVIAKMASGIGAASSRVPAGIARYALIAWLATSVILLLVHLLVNRRVIRQRGTWPVATLAGGTVRVAPALGPAVVGLASPQIVVPRWLLDKSAEEQRLVMVHEQEHIAARDQYLPVVALVVATLLPWHPAVWWALARLRLAVELDCDARVLRRGVHAQPYGSLLIDIAGQCAGHRVGALALADRPSHLERRIRAMTHRSTHLTLARTVGLCMIAALAVVTACEARLPTSTEVQAMDVASAVKAMVQSKMLEVQAAQNAVYVVDGETVAAEKALAIPANRIATVNVVKATEKTEGTALTTIRITTVGATERVQLAQRVDTLLQRSKVPYGRNLAPPMPPQGNTMTPKEFAGIVFVDGVRAPSNTLSKLSPKDIASVEVMKGDAARAAYGSEPAAANGVIRITMKHAK